MSLNGHYHNETRAYLLELQAGHKPERPNIPPYWQEMTQKIESLYDRAAGDAIAVSRYISTLSKLEPDLAKLLKPPAQKASPDKNQTELERLGVPALLEEARQPVDPALCEAYRLLLAYERFSKEASPEGYPEFHIFCGLWLLSVITARRVYINLAREKVYTNLRIALCAESSDWAKSFTANVATSVLQELGFGHLQVRPGRITAEKLLSNMAGKRVPSSYGDLCQSTEEEDYEKRKLIDKKIAMAGQKGMYWDEFGKFIKSIMRESSPMASFLDFLLTIEDCSTTGSDTFSRGDEALEKPYLTILGSMVASTLKTVMRPGSELWEDGFMARTSIICAPEKDPNDIKDNTTVDAGLLPIPHSLRKAFIEWNEWLGEPEVKIDVENDNAIITLKELPEYECRLTPEADAARKAYRFALKKMAHGKEFPKDLKANYIRLATTALRIAMLLAAIERRSHPDKTHIPVTLTHWATAQMLTEQLRINLHRFYAEVSGYKTSASSIEDDIIAVFRRQTKNGKEWFTPNEIRRFLNNRLSTKEINDVLRPLRGAKLEWKTSNHGPNGLYKLMEDTPEGEEPE